MNTVKVDGIVYTKAATLAKQFHYTSDYIGQLCRAKKVDCQLVGRSWYVSETSLLEHKESRYREVRESEKTIKINNFSEDSTPVITVRSPLKKLAAREIVARQFDTPAHGIRSSYLPDDGDLLPQPLRRKKILPTIPVALTMPSKTEHEVDLVDTPSLKVDTIESEAVTEESMSLEVSSTQASKIELDFTPLPEVLLQGSVPVVSVDAPQVVVPKTRPTAVVPTLKPIVSTKRTPTRVIPPRLPTTDDEHFSTLPTTVRFTPSTVEAPVVVVSMAWYVVPAFIAALVLSLFTLSTTQQYTLEGMSMVGGVAFELLPTEEILVLFFR